MYEIIMNIIIPSFAIAIVGAVYMQILTIPGAILEIYYLKLEAMKWKWLSKPLGECMYCMTGQMALWYYLYANWNNYSILQHIAFISLTLFFVEIISKIISWAQN